MFKKVEEIEHLQAGSSGIEYLMVALRYKAMLTSFSRHNIDVTELLSVARNVTSIEDLDAVLNSCENLITKLFPRGDSQT
jgi:hypothetical protein